MNKERQPISARLALFLEQLTVSPPSQKNQPEGITRREFFLKARREVRKEVEKSLPWLIPLLVTGAGASIALFFLSKMTDENGQVKLSPEVSKELKNGPNGEKLYFWNPHQLFGISSEEGRTIRFVNETSNLFSAYNDRVFEALLQEEDIKLDKVGAVDFVIVPTGALVKKENRRVFLVVNEEKELAKEEKFLKEASQSISAGVGAILSLSQKKGDFFWQSGEAEEQARVERERLLKKFDWEGVPPFSLWREIPE